MRTAVTIAVRHGATRAEMILGPEKEVREHHLAFKVASRSVTNSEFQSIAVWESESGIVKQRNFSRVPTATAAPVSDGGSLPKRGAFGTKK